MCWGTCAVTEGGAERHTAGRMKNFSSNLAKSSTTFTFVWGCENVKSCEAINLWWLATAAHFCCCASVWKHIMSLSFSTFWHWSKLLTTLLFCEGKKIKTFQAYFSSMCAMLFTSQDDLFLPMRGNHRSCLQAHARVEDEVKLLFSLRTAHENVTNEKNADWLWPPKVLYQDRVKKKINK